MVILSWWVVLSELILVTNEAITAHENNVFYLFYLKDIFCHFQEARSESRSVMSLDFLSCKRATVLSVNSDVIVAMCIKL